MKTGCDCPECQHIKEMHYKSLNISYYILHRYLPGSRLYLNDTPFFIPDDFIVHNESLLFKYCSSWEQGIDGRWVYFIKPNKNRKLILNCFKNPATLILDEIKRLSNV